MNSHADNISLYGEENLITKPKFKKELLDALTKVNYLIFELVILTDLQ